MKVADGVAPDAPCLIPAPARASRGDAAAGRQGHLPMPTRPHRIGPRTSSTRCGGSVTSTTASPICIRACRQAHDRQVKIDDQLISGKLRDRGRPRWMQVPDLFMTVICRSGSGARPGVPAPRVSQLSLRSPCVTSSTPSSRTRRSLMLGRQTIISTTPLSIGELPITAAALDLGEWTMEGKMCGELLSHTLGLIVLTRRSPSMSSGASVPHNGWSINQSCCPVHVRGRGSIR